MKIVGDVELIDHLNRKAGTVGALAAAALRKTASDITRTAKTNAPVDTGNLRASIGATITGDGRTGTMRAEIGPTAVYGAYVETGTSRMAGQPYLFPAVEQHAPGYYATLEQIVGR